MEQNDYLKLAVSILAIIITVILYVLYKNSRRSRTSILLIGLRESGKTLTFSQLVHGKYVETFTSIKENIGDIEINNDTLRIIDIPGHEQLRYKFFDKYKPTAKAIIFVIDSTLDSANFKDTAECLYNILSDPLTIHNRLPILILCNKQDYSTASKYDFLKQKLEEEFAVLRVTKSHQLESVDSKSKRNVYLGNEGDKFKFEDLPMKVSFEEISAKEQKGKMAERGIEDLKKWLIKIA